VLQYRFRTDGSPDRRETDWDWRPISQAYYPLDHVILEGGLVEVRLRSSGQWGTAVLDPRRILPGLSPLRFWAGGYGSYKTLSRRRWVGGGYEEVFLVPSDIGTFEISFLGVAYRNHSSIRIQPNLVLRRLYLPNIPRPGAIPAVTPVFGSPKAPDTYGMVRPKLPATDLAGSIKNPLATAQRLEVRISSNGKPGSIGNIPRIKVEKPRLLAELSALLASEIKRRSHG